MTTIGIVGPHDLVASSARICSELSGVRVAQLPYDRETDTLEVIRSAPADIDAWLFTGVVPYQIAESASLLDRPAVPVGYTGATLLLALVQLLRDGHDISSLSIDTLERGQVVETLEEAGLSVRKIRVLPYRPSLHSDDLVAFHQRSAGRHRATVSITCLRSVYDQLHDEQLTVRLAPSVHSVRAAATKLLMERNAQQSDDAQIALGLVEIENGDLATLEREFAGLGGTVVRYDEHRFLVVTTRGPLEQFTESFTGLPALTRLQSLYGDVRIGFGIGASGAEARILASKALGRSQTSSSSTAIVSLRNDTDITLAGATSPRPRRRPSLELLSQRTGVAKSTLERFSQLVAATSDNGVTTRVVADYLGVQLRTARRLLNRLERAGVAHPTGIQTLEGPGRPLVVYRVQL